MRNKSLHFVFVGSLAAFALAVLAPSAFAAIKLISHDEAASALVSEEGDTMGVGQGEVKAAKTAAPKAAVPDAKKKNEKTAEKTLNGTVSFIRKNKMSVQFAEDKNGAEEMYLAIDQKVKLHRMRNLSDLGQGDAIKVKFVQTYRDPDKKGGEPVIVSNVVTDITFVSKAKTGAELVSDNKAG